MKCRIPILSRKMQKELDSHVKQRVAEHYEQQGEEQTHFGAYALQSGKEMVSVGKYKRVVNTLLAHGIITSE